MSCTKSDLSPDQFPATSKQTYLAKTFLFTSDSTFKFINI